MSNPEEVIARRVAELYRSGRPVKEIAEELGLSMSTIYRLLQRQGVQLRRQRYQTRGRLRQEELERIKEMYLRGETIYAIAKKLGRPPSTIYYALRRLGLKEKEGEQEEVNSGVHQRAQGGLPHPSR